MTRELLKSPSGAPNFVVISGSEPARVSHMSLKFVFDRYGSRTGAIPREG